MHTMSSVRLLAAGALAILLASCATAPKPLQGQFPAVTPRDASSGVQVGAQVRWGGRIVETKPGANDTCFEVISAPLNSTGRPLRDSPDTTDGRFIACRSGFYDPAIFTKGREVTFVGHIAGVENTRIGEYDYRLPRVAADVVYLWPKIRDVELRPYPSPYFYDPFWGPGWGPGPGPHWGWGGGWW